MNRTWVAVTLLAAGFGAGCGNGRAIFNIDVYSFFAGSSKDTVHYVVPPTTSNFAVPTPAQKVSLVPGLSSSGIDTVKVTGTVDFRNDSGGPGSLSFQVYLASDSAGTYTAGRDSMFRPQVTVSNLSGTNIQSGVVLNAPNLSPTGDSLFNKSAVWIRIAATVSNPNASYLGGRAVLASLQLRVVVQDKIF